MSKVDITHRAGAIQRWAESPRCYNADFIARFIVNLCTFARWCATFRFNADAFALRTFSEFALHALIA
jgi:hypothetical protein